MVPLEDIEKMAKAVLRIKLPAEIHSVINNINNLINNPTRSQDDTKKLGEEVAQELLQKAEEVKLVSENTKYQLTDQHNKCLLFDLTEKKKFQTFRPSTQISQHFVKLEKKRFFPIKTQPDWMTSGIF